MVTLIKLIISVSKVNIFSLVRMENSLMPEEKQNMKGKTGEIDHRLRVNRNVF